jgi:hypothetical protein
MVVTKVNEPPLPILYMVAVLEGVVLLKTSSFVTKYGPTAGRCAAYAPEAHSATTTASKAIVESQFANRFMIFSCCVCREFRRERTNMTQRLIFDASAKPSPEKRKMSKARAPKRTNFFTDECECQAESFPGAGFQWYTAKLCVRVAKLCATLTMLLEMIFDPGASSQ